MTPHRPIRVRRTVMFTPGTQPERVAKMLEKGTADTLIVDWEDAVAPPDKAKAREVTRDAWADLPESRTERVIRVNDARTEWHKDDLAAAVPLAPDAIMLPKVERPQDVARVDERLTALEGARATATTERDGSGGSVAAAGLPSGRIKLIVLFETGRGVLRALECAEASPRVDALVFGAEDYQADVGGRRRRDNADVHWARSAVAAVAAARRVAALDQVFIDYNDPEGLRAEAEQARDLGYRGKMVIHPKQIGIVNDVFTPTKDEIAHAERVLAAADEAEKAGKGAFALDGKMIDRPLIEQARRVMETARAAGVVE